ncbi:RecQ family ATP-dependent DNA helicase [Sphingomonas sp. Leaf10]|uniref:RecQ family ATP-dependent DNA helicase n=1 Tax=Sphingomonas sp. Leaf10 TaxID=1735676 RepID=UPI0006F31602|nr:RecQ family ATP-dependent DNA helicase [Sphingomonas sp. Leaf10]KQM38810.1 ATP-dependent DNA helicase RecG [Sphingomonas sp. Leaf10]
MFDRNRALSLLRTGSQRQDADFRDDQEEAIRHLVEGNGRLLVVQKTGWGKSFVYFIAARLLREQGFGPSLLISPLLSLMRNQIAAAERMGVRAVTLHSGNVAEWPEIEARIAQDDVDIILVSPERLANEHFQTEVMAGIAPRIAMLVIDEAHCISDWGHDFRPQYRLIERMVRRLPTNLRLLATTATANDRVLRDLTEVLGPDIAVSRGDLNRPSLTLQTIRLPGQAERLAWLADQLETLPGHGIIYTLTIRDAEMVAAWLRSRNFAVAAYTGESGEQREALEQDLLHNRVKALVATTALGMGYDKPDLAFVIHYQVPGSAVAYYQQVGRAGRGLDAAYGVLLSGEEEGRITDWFIDSAFPKPDEVEQIIAALDAAPEGLSIPEMQSVVNLSVGRITHAIQLLSLESPAPLAKQGARWQLTAAPLGNDFWSRAERLTSLRKDEQRQMEEYVALPFGTHMPFLVAALDGDPSGIAPPSLPQLPTAPDAATVRDAVTFLRRTDLPIEPRKQWPGGGLPRYGLSGRVAAERQAEAGKALSVWGDAGWGSLVRAGKYQNGRFDEELVHACRKMVIDWNPQPCPEWVTCIPSSRNPDLVPDFARRLAIELGLPFLPVLRKAEDRPEQKAMANSVQQARNVDGSLAIDEGSVPHGPVLLIDDMVDSRWTLTVAAWLLREAGSGEVWPLALSKTGHGE